ncbi:reverse transcriptase [Phytophthora megakarya]|uniref:Reverse transcriptase n=1 Tax=Phytophthora megakarya TaxID=4795 RepID=A0A225WZ38_9STRA|nr:reverse transcriptase [Phytophthora megakarya]
MDCKSPELKLLRQQAWNVSRTWLEHEFIHVRRGWNASADMLAGQALQRRRGKVTYSLDEVKDIKTLNRLQEVIRSLTTDADGAKLETREHELTQTRDIAKPGMKRMVPVITRYWDAENRATTTPKPDVLQELVVQRIRLDCIRMAQEEELWIFNLKQFFVEGNIGELSKHEVRDCAIFAGQYEVGECGLLYYHVRGNETAEDRNVIMKLVVAETLRDDILYHYHAEPTSEFGNISIGQACSEACKITWGSVRIARPGKEGRRSNGNRPETSLRRTHSRSDIPSLPASYKRNTELLVRVDLFTDFVIAKTSASRTAQTVAESYEEAEFRRLGASEVIRHDRELGFMSDFFRAFNRLMGQRQRATLAYRPQANGAAERMVQTISRAIKMYIADVEQRASDKYADRLIYALNTAHDRTRDETPSSVDPQFTLEATLAVGNTSTHDIEACCWRLQIQRHYKIARAQALELVREAVETRARRQDERATEEAYSEGSQVWLYLDRLKPG